MTDRFEIQMGTESMLRDMVDMEERRREKAEAKLARIEALCDASDSEGDIAVRDVRAILSGKTSS